MKGLGQGLACGVLDLGTLSESFRDLVIGHVDSTLLQA